jgi:hypothetical protein
LGVAVAVLPAVDQIASGGLALIADGVGFWREGASGRRVGEEASTCEAGQRFVCGGPRDFDSEAPVKGEEVVSSLSKGEGEGLARVWTRLKGCIDPLRRLR